MCRPLNDSADAERASHDLRTPITALRLRLEDLTQWEATTADVTAELRHAIDDLDRLADAVTRVLDERRPDPPPCD